MAKRKVAAGTTPGGLIIRRWVRHWITGKRIYPVHAKALAFFPRRKRR